MPIFVPFLRNLMRRGRLTVIDAAGRSHVICGVESSDDRRPVTVRLHDPRLHWMIPLRPSLAVGEAYMNGTLTIEEGTLFDFLALAGENLQRVDPRFTPGERLLYLLRRFQQWNPIRASRQNVAHHYDLSEEFYSLFLDADRQYSCAYFSDPGMSLEEAQSAKKRHIIAKLMLEPGQKVLDIGCGWGGLALSIARAADVEVTGITLSEEQLKVAQRRVEAEQLSHRVHFELCDYRQIAGKFDRIVSVGMFEHVGVPQYSAFFRRVRDLLTDNGVALLHSIGRSSGPGVTNSWIRKYIFPGGYSPALSEVLPTVELSGLEIGDIELMHLHYADTLRQWRTRFVEHWAKAAALYDERFCRMWEFYLAGSEVAFRYQDHLVFQMQLHRHRRTIPRTRDYIARDEEKLVLI